MRSILEFAMNLITILMVLFVSTGAQIENLHIESPCQLHDEIEGWLSVNFS